MKTNLFQDFPEMSAEERKTQMEADNVGVEEMHEFIKAFTPEEQVAAENLYLELSKDLSTLMAKLQAVSEPLKAEMKPIRVELAQLIEKLKKGGDQVTEKVYLFPDYENKMMGRYDSRGLLIDTRPFNRSERQLHINSPIHVSHSFKTGTAE